MEQFIWETILSGKYIWPGHDLGLGDIQSIGGWIVVDENVQRVTLKVDCENGGMHQTVGHSTHQLCVHTLFVHL